MFIFLQVAGLSFEFTLKQTTLYVSGSGVLTREEVLANCDYQIITEVFIGEGITSFTVGIFDHFASLKRLNLPSTLQSTSGADTTYCYALETISIAESHQYLELDKFGALYNKGKTKLIRFPPKRSVTNFTFPLETTIIGEYAFQYCVTIPQLTISNKIIEIKYGIFEDSTGIERIIFEKGSSFSIIDRFSYAYVLKYVFLTKNITKINNRGFYYCWRLEIVEFENDSQLIEIQHSAFFKTRIKEFVFPGKCLIIGSSIFNQNIHLTTIHIPASLVNIHTDAFLGVPSLSNIIVDENNPVYTVVHPGTLMFKNKTKILYIPVSTTDFVIQPEVEEVGTTMFQLSKELTSISVDPLNTKFSAYEGIIYTEGYRTAIACIGGITSVETRSECTRIGNYCFYNYSKLNSIILNNGITLLETGSFSNLYLDSIDIPSTVQVIQSCCFQYSNINTITTNDGGPKIYGLLRLIHVLLSKSHLEVILNLWNLEYLDIQQLSQ